MDDLLKLALAGRLDELTPEQVVALEAYVNTTPAAAEALADEVAPFIDEFVSAVPAPSEDAWADVWEQIGGRFPTSRSPSRADADAAGPRRLIRRWQPLAAAAACIAAILTWRISASPVPEIEVSADVVVHEVEVYGDDSAFVAYDEDGTAVVWVFEDDSENEGT